MADLEAAFLVGHLDIGKGKEKEDTFYVLGLWTYRELFPKLRR